MSPTVVDETPVLRIPSTTRFLSSGYQFSKKMVTLLKVKKHIGHTISIASNEEYEVAKQLCEIRTRM